MLPKHGAPNVVAEWDDLGIMSHSLGADLLVQMLQSNKTFAKASTIYYVGFRCYSQRLMLTPFQINANHLPMKTFEHTHATWMHTCKPIRKHTLHAHPHTHTPTHMHIHHRQLLSSSPLVFTSTSHWVFPSRHWPMAPSCAQSLPPAAGMTLATSTSMTSWCAREYS